MPNQEPVNQPNQPKEDIIKTSLNRLKLRLVLMRKTRIRLWQATLIIVFISGFASALTLAISRDWFGKIKGAPLTTVDQSATQGGPRKIESWEEIMQEILPEPPKYQGFIIQFQEAPSIIKWTELEKQQDQGIIDAASASSQLSAYKSSLNSKFNSHKASLRSIVLNFDSKIKREFKSVFNGIALDISDTEAERIKRQTFIKDVYPNYEVKATLMDSVSMINADDVWNLGYKGEGTTIAILDTGIDYSHPDLGGCFGQNCKVVDGYDFVNNDNDPMDDHGHGTHCAGIAASNGNLKGVAPEANLLAYKVLNSGGRGNDDGIIAAIERAVDPDQNGDYSDQADIILMSVGGPGDPDDSVSQAVDNTVEAGVVVAISAGNSGPGGDSYCRQPWTGDGTINSICSPGTARKAITVGAQCRPSQIGIYQECSDDIATFSSRGPVVWDNGAIIKPDVVAPGVGICASKWSGDRSGNRCFDDRHCVFSGTSMAAPHVAGAAALIKQAHPDWKSEEIKMALRKTTIDLGKNILSQGYGSIDVLGAVQLAAAPPIAQIDTSGEISGDVSEIIDIYGIATSDDFQNYTLYYGTENYGQGYEPTEWTKICTSSIQVTEGVLCSGFITPPQDGNHILRLVVVDTYGQISEDRTIITIDNIDLTQPADNDVFNTKDTIKIRGTVGGRGFQNYIIEYGIGEDPIEWLRTGIDLVSGGLVSIIDDVLATWDLSMVPGEDIYTIRVTVDYNTGQDIVFVENIYLDSLLREGWPVRAPIGTSALHYDGRRSFQIVNINEDPYDELILIDKADYYGASLSLYAFDYQGKLLFGWPFSPVPTGPNSDRQRMQDIAIGDINKDGDKEIVVATGEAEYIVPRDVGHIYILNDKAEIERSWNTIGWPDRVVIADIDKEIAGKEIIVTSFNDVIDRKLITVFDHEGNILVGWPQEIDDISDGLGGRQQLPAVADLDNDQEFEIVCLAESEEPSENISLRIYDKGGILRAYSNIANASFNWAHSPVVGDLDGDGNIEIVVRYDDNNIEEPMISVWDHQLNLIPGWPQALTINADNSLTLGDINNDDRLEIIVCDSRSSYYPSGYYYAYTWDGNLLWKIPQPIKEFGTRTVFGDATSAVIGDITGDFIPEIIFGNVVLNNQGELLEGWTPRYSVNYFTTEEGAMFAFLYHNYHHAAAIVDMDKDGRLEVVRVSTNDDFVYVWELDVPYNESTMEWPMFQHDPQHTGNYHFGRQCTDGTPYGQCSTDKPKYCGNGKLVDNCQKCGCPGEAVCQNDGTCLEPPRQCWTNTDCGTVEDDGISLAINIFCEFPAGTCQGPGACISRPENCIALWDPVCGCDNRTYSNDCKRQQAGVSKKDTGRCQLRR